MQNDAPSHDAGDNRQRPAGQHPHGHNGGQGQNQGQGNGYEQREPNRRRRRRGRGRNRNRDRFDNGPERFEHGHEQAPAEPEVQAEPIPEPDLTVPTDKTIVIGLTGEPGAGKSSLALAFVSLGGSVIDVDALGHQVLETAAVQKKLVAEFGAEVLVDGIIDRPALAQRAFATPEKLAALDKITRVALTKKVKTAVAKAGNFVIIDAARLHDLKLDEGCNATIFVRAPIEQRLSRVQSRGWTLEELQRRDAALGLTDDLRRRCTMTIDNTGDHNLLLAFAKTILARQLGIDLPSRRALGVASTNGGHPRPVTAVPPKQIQPGQQAQAGQAAPLAQPIAPPQPPPEPVHLVLNEYLSRPLASLQDEAQGMDIRDIPCLTKADLIGEILRRKAGGRSDDILVEGYVELEKKEMSGSIRLPHFKYSTTNIDAFIGNPLIRRYGLKAGMHITGLARAPRGNERCPQLLTVQTIMGEDAAKPTHVMPFQDLIPLHATDRLFMERHDQPDDYNLRIIDLIAPIGKGQRGLIVSQPKCGKTVYLQKIANAICHNNPEVTLFILLIDERPEEVTDMERSVPKAEVVASTFDQHASRHVQIAEMVINKAKRLVERGKDVVILLDSITRLARAYNTEAPSSGRIMSGGIESGALIKPKQFFGAARNIENGGSLTILATALVDTGSVMDTVIFEEFKGTGNMELVLDRRLADRRIFPAINIPASGTRKDELIIKSDDEMRRLWAIRRYLSERSSQDAVEFIKGKLKQSKTNIEFLLKLDPERIATSW